MEKISRIIVIVMLVVMSQGAMARRVSQEQAGVYARNWWLQKDGSRKALLQPVATEFGNIYLFVDTAGRGFVMLAADDRSLPVLGYSLRNGFEVDSMPAAVHDWIQAYNDEIQYLIDNNIEKTAEINAKWEDLNNERSQLPQAWSTQVGPLVQSKWGQGYPFYNQCPFIGSSRTLTGCVATAMAQIMNYHEFPTTGVGQHQYYSSSTSSYLSANFGTTTYQWSSMPDVADGTWDAAKKTAVATLMYHVGVAVEMDYRTIASSAQTVAMTYDEPAAVNAYKEYFHYKWTARAVCMDDYTETAWKQLLKDEIDNNRPMQYGGHGGGGGHSFVCDGYNTNEMFHFNWGWKGDYDGYYAVGALNVNPDGSGGYEHQYNYSNYAIIGIEPDRSAGGPTTVTVNVNNPSLGSVSGAGSYSASSYVVLTPQANTGCKFVEWSNGSRDVPLKFKTNGENVTLTARFERLSGDTLNYCNSACIKVYGNSSTYQYWGIKIPASSFTPGSYLTDIMFYAPLNEYYDVYINQGSFNATTSANYYTQNIRTYTAYSWYNVAVPTNKQFVVTQDVYVVIRSKYIAASMPSANSDASYYSTNASGPWSHQTNAGNADVSWMIKVVAATEHKITLNKNMVNLTSTSNEASLYNLGRSNRGAPVSYQVVSSTPDNIAIITESYGYYYLTASGAGIVRVKATATDPTLGLAEAEIDLQIERGTLSFKCYGGDPGSWYDVSNWYPNKNVIPDSTNYDVTISYGTCVVDNNAQCHDLSINGMWNEIIVERSAVLSVSGNFDNDDASKLTIKADEDGSGTVIFGSGTPKATVEMYMKGTIGSDGKDPDWQLRGSIVGSDFDLENDNSEWNNIHVYEWDELLNAGGCWKNKMVGSQVALDPWKGYGFANYTTSPKTITYTGTLINSDKTWTLTKTGSGNANVGNNMLTNSYAAPIEIAKMQFNNAKASVIFYNTGSLLEWQQFHGDTTNSGYGAGQMLVCPAWTAAAAGMPTAIPSGQSFYVVANQDGATVSVNYSDVMRATSEPMLMPEEEFNVLGVRIKGENGGDRIVLIESERCGDEYDDGYDGMKYFGSAEMPQLFVVNGFGNTSINASQTMIGQRIGVEYGSGKRLKMAFETEKLTGYGQLMLHDLKTGQYVDILGNAEYEFVTTDDDGARFEIVRSKHEAEGEMTVSGNELYTGENEGRLMISDMSGRVLWERDVQRNETVQLPELLHGVYVIKSETSTIKIVR